MRWIAIALLTISSLSWAEEAKKPSASQKSVRPDFREIVKIDLDQTAIRSVVLFYGAAIFRASDRSLYLDESILRAIWETEKTLFGEEQARKNFDHIQVYASPCLPPASDIYARVFVDYITCAQLFIVENSWNMRVFCRYWARFYHAGGPGKTKAAREKNDKEYGKDTVAIWRHEIKKMNRGYWDDPVMLSWDNQMVLYHSLLYAAHLPFVKTLRRVEGGRYGKEMGHESPNNKAVYGSPCVPPNARQYAKGTRSYFVALQNFITKDGWWRKAFFKRYAKYRKLGKLEAKYVKIILEERHEQRELQKARIKLGGYDPVVIEKRVQMDTGEKNVRNRSAGESNKDH